MLRASDDVHVRIHVSALKRDTDLQCIYIIYYVCGYVQIQQNLRKKPKYGFEIFFRAHLRARFFSLFVVLRVICSIYKRNSCLKSVHRMVYFF